MELGYLFCYLHNLASYIHAEKVNKVFRSSCILLGKLSSVSHEFPSTNWIPNIPRTVHILFSMKVDCVVDLSGRLKEGVCLFWYSLLLLFCCIDLNFDNLPLNAEVQGNDWNLKSLCTCLDKKTELIMTRFHVNKYMPVKVSF